MPTARKKAAARLTRGPHYSGLHVSERRRITASAEQLAAMDAYVDANEPGLSWAQWALGVLLAKIKFKRAKEAQR